MAAYGFAHEGRVYTPDGPIETTDNDARNRELEARELAYWAAQPQQFLAYYRTPPAAVHRAPFRTVGDVTTWLGTVIGTIAEARVYRHNFGARMISLRVRGSNGATYYGRASFDHGTSIMLHKSTG